MEIKFQAIDQVSDAVLDIPKPAVMSIPDWYKNSPTRMDGEKADGLSKETVAVSNLTIKGCSPFLDALSFGYIYELPFDIEFRKDPIKGLGIRWATEMDLISGHTADQYQLLPDPVDGLSGVLKWVFPFKLETPIGYSCLFTHPLNRHDLPFRTFSGVVDTDTYPGAVQFPFQLLSTILEKDIFILEKGTPLCQIVPFKRDDWDSSKEEYNELANKKAHFSLKSKIVRSYKTQWWNKKSFR